MDENDRNGKADTLFLCFSVFNIQGFYIHSLSFFLRYTFEKWGHIPVLPGIQIIVLFKEQFRPGF